MTTLGPETRRLISTLAECIIPRSDAMPGAADIALAEAPLDRAMQHRPDLAGNLASLPAIDPGDDGETYLRRLECEQPALHQALLQAVLGAYYMDPEVKRRLGYHGQQALTLPRGGFGGEEHIEPVMARPPHYRKTPAYTAERNN